MTGSSRLPICPSWIAAPIRHAVTDLATDIDIQRVFGVLPNSYRSSAIFPSLIANKPLTRFSEA